MYLEILLYLVSAIGALFITGYSVHMLIGGLVSSETEYKVITIVCLVVVLATGYMVWDVIRRRTGKK
jgi:hypothetical protein